MIDLVYIPLSVNNIKDVTKDYDDIINGFHFRRISCFFLSQCRDNHAKGRYQLVTVGYESPVKVLKKQGFRTTLTGLP
jgi:hypothetical protein